MAGRLWSGVFATRDLQLVGLVLCLCYRVSAVRLGRKEVVASYLALPVVVLGRVCLLHHHRGVLCFVLFSAA